MTPAYRLAATGCLLPPYAIFVRRCRVQYNSLAIRGSSVCAHCARVRRRVSAHGNVLCVWLYLSLFVNKCSCSCIARARAQWAFSAIVRRHLSANKEVYLVTFFETLTRYYACTFIANKLRCRVRVAIGTLPYSGHHTVTDRRYLPVSATKNGERPRLLPPRVRTGSLEENPFFRFNICITHRTLE